MQMTVRIERYADQGRCVGHVEGRVVFVRFALPGELVDVELDEPHERKDRFWTGEVVKVHEANPQRVVPVWPLAGPVSQGGGVGGADLIHVSTAGQRAWKSAVITEQMRRLGHLKLDAVPVAQVPGDETLGGLHWRTRIEMIADDAGHPSMRRRGSHRRVAIDTMPLASKAVLAVAEQTGVWNGGFKPGARLRLAVPEPRAKTVDSAGSDGFPPQDRTDTVGAPEDRIGDNYALLVDDELAAGTSLLHETSEIAGKGFDFGVRADGFWQVHRQAPMVLPDHVISQVQRLLNGRDDAVIWDLYAGSGLFTLPLATCTVGRPHLFSVEGSKFAVKQARANLDDAGIDDADVHVGDVGKVLRHVPKRLIHPDVVVLDPPRAGARADVCRRIAQTGAHGVVYVACDPTSLARDTATFVHEGYRLEHIQAFDIYPMTHHVETIAVFIRGRAR